MNCYLEIERRVMNQANELEDRMIDFAVRIIQLADSLPETPAAKHIARQILRSGTSPAPNYAEARGAESHADFVSKNTHQELINQIKKDYKFLFLNFGN